MQRRPAFVVALALSLAIATVTVPSPVASAPLVAVRAGSVTGWVPYFNGPKTNGVNSIDAAAATGTMTEVMPFFYSATGASDIRTVGTADDLLAVTRAARARGMRILPSITDGTGQLVMQGILADPATRTQHVDRIVALVLTGVDDIAYDGIDIDYEGFAFTDGRATWPQTQPLWLAFVKALGEKLHAQGKLLSITVPPIWDDGRSGYTVYGPWNQVTPYADRLRLMVYDWSVSAPGPTAPMSWVRNVIAYVQKTIPADVGKVWLGVPAYGRSWAKVTSGECPALLPTGVALSTTTVQTRNAPALAASHGATITDAKAANGSSEGESTFSWVVGTYTGPKSVTPTPGPYVPPPTVANQIPGSAADTNGLAPAVRLKPVAVNVTCTISRIVHVPDNASIVLRAQTAQAAGLGGIAIWALGYEPPELWPALAAG